MGMNDRKDTKRSSGKRKPKSFDFQGYVDVPLSKQQTETVSSEYELTESTETYTALCALVSDGFEIKFKQMDGGSTIACQLLDARPDSGSFGWILTGFASDADKAAFVALYKHHVICEGIWDTTPRQKAMWG